MANYFTHLAFEIPATADEAESFSKVIEEAAVAADNSNGTNNEVELEGLACRFDKESETLAIFATDGALNLWALAETLQQLFPEKQPLGFVYSCSCDKPRSDGLDGGLFAVGSDNIVQHELGELLAEEISYLSETTNAG